MSNNKVTDALTVTENHTSAMPSDNELTCSLGAVKTKNSLFAIFETLIGITVLAVLLRSTDVIYPEVAGKLVLAFVLFIVSSAFRSFVLLLSYMLSPRAEDVLPKTIFEFLHNASACILCAPTSFALMVIFGIAHNEDPVFHAELILTVLGLATSALYCFGAFYSYKSFKSS